MAWNLTDPSSVNARTGLRLLLALQLVWFFRDGMAEGQRWLEQTIAASCPFEAASSRATRRARHESRCDRAQLAR
jgi:hypothetical protein